MRHTADLPVVCMWLRLCSALNFLFNIFNEFTIVRYVFCYRYQGWLDTETASMC